MKTRLLFCLAAFSFASLAHAQQVLQLDFGSTPVTGASQTNSPYHTANGSFTDSQWNQIQTTDILADGLKWSDNTTATGVSVNVGATTTSLSTTIGLTSQPSGNSALGVSTSTGIYE